jgi:hypothetical protein
MGAGSAGAYATLVATKEFALGAVVLARKNYQRTINYKRDVDRTLRRSERQGTGKRVFALSRRCV